VEEVRTIARDINTTMAGFIRGQGTVCLLLGLFYAVGLSLAGLKFGLAIGMGAGLLSFIPYVGAIVGGVLAIGVGLVQFWPDYSSVLIIIGIFVAGQFLEGNFLSPKLVGGSIGLHPVWLMFALFSFSYLFGFVGLLLAVPLAAAMGVLVRYGLRRYLASKLYTGTEPSLDDLQHRPALGRDDFLVAGSNAAAVQLVDDWPNWPARASVLVGPPGSGKSHLGEVWRQRSSASLVSATEICVERVPDVLSFGVALVEDIDRGVLQEKALFHLLNYAQEMHGHILFTARDWPLRDVVLPDLQSRLNAVPIVTILPPDDGLLRGVLVKLFSDRQIAVDEALISYLVNRMPRSLDMARQLVARMDAAALERKVDVTRRFAGQILEEWESPDLL
jgi:AI-2E family transporter